MSVEYLDEWRKKRDEATASKSQSTQNTQSDELGPILIDDDEKKAISNILVVLTRARLSPFTTKSDFARMAANEIALCASDGLITTKVAEGEYSNTWLITQDGFQAMEDLQNVLGLRH